MSQVLAGQAASSAVAAKGPARGASGRETARGVVVWSLGVSLMLVGSGVIRAVQSSEYAAESSYMVDCPFPLSTIPRQIGEWRAMEGSDVVLDPLTTRISGSTDHIMRSYVDEMTGVMLSVLILFGPAEPVLPHTPQICYPSSGHKAVADPVDRDIKIGDGETARFRTSVFAKSGGRAVIRNVVYHSFLLEKPWTPAITAQKFPRKNPGIFKVQIQRRIGDGETVGSNEPVEDFIQNLLPVLDKMIRNAAPTPTPPAVAASKA